MNKLSSKLGFLAGLSLLLFSGNVKAILTTDIAEAAGRISATAGDVLRAVQKNIDATEHKIYGDLLGEGNKETKMILPTIDGWKVNYAKDKLALGANGDTYAASAGLSSRISKVEDKIKELLAQKAQVGKEREELNKIKEEELNAKIAEIDANIAALMGNSGDFDELEMENAIGEYEGDKEELEKELADLKKQNEAQQALDEKALQKLLDDLNAEKQKLLANLKKELENAALGAVNLDSPGSSLDRAKKQNYVQDEVAEDVKDLRIKRFIERRNAITSTYTEAIQLKYRMYTEPLVFKRFTGSAEDMETLVGQAGMDVEMKVKIIELLMQQANMMVNDLREDTAIEYAALRFYKMRQPENNLYEFNLDDYIFDCSSK